jgi:hypothetical protein
MIDSTNSAIESGDPDEIIKSILANLTEEQKQSLIDQAVGVQSDVFSGVKKEQISGKSYIAAGIANEERPSTVNEDFTVNRTPAKEGRQPVRAKKNKWTDEGEAHRDIETPMFERTPRARKEHKMEEVECHVCGKSFKVDPKHVYGKFHRCNRCGGR